jgi:Protein of unknown function (DUF3644).
MVKRNPKNRLERWEVSLVKAMLAKGTFGNDQDILAYFTRPNRSINHARISEIDTGHKHANVRTATDEELQRFLRDWPQIDPATGLHLLGDELLIKAREAMLVAVQSYNNPKTHFRSEIFIVTAIIAWTYLFHAFFRRENIDYRYTRKKPDGTVEVQKTPQDADKYWELGHCLKHAKSPLDDGTKRNLEFLIDIRHEIEHRMTSRIDDTLSAKLQACCLNFNRVLKALFGAQYGLDGELSFALQFAAIDFDQRKALLPAADLSPTIEAVRARYEDGLTDEQYNDPHYAYRVLFVPKVANKKGQADAVMEFVKPGSEEADAINKAYIKEVDKPRLRPGKVVERIQAAGFKKFDMQHHTELWKALDAKNPGKGFGVQTESDGWRWYERWVDEVRRHCEANRDKYA